MRLWVSRKFEILNIQIRSNKISHQHFEIPLESETKSYNINRLKFSYHAPHSEVIFVFKKLLITKIERKRETEREGEGVVSIFYSTNCEWQMPFSYFLTTTMFL